MSSVSASLAQIPGRSGLLVAVAATDRFAVNGTVSALQTTTAFSSNTTFQSNVDATGTLFVDMGKLAVAVNSKGQHIAHYRLVQKVLGADTEGVPDAYATSPAFYVCVWSTNTGSTPVTVVRTG
jgi:hypothetical protein